jgi:hypothetical protein
MRSIKLIFMVLCAVILQACSSVILPTVAKLSGLSPLEADPQDFQIAVTLPDGVAIPEGGAKFGFAFARSDTGEAHSESYPLEQRETRDGKTLFRIAPSDIEALRAFQAMAAAWEAEDPRATSGSITMSVVACSVGDGPAPDATFSTAVRISADGLFLPLIRNARVADVIEYVADHPGLTEQSLCQ